MLTAACVALAELLRAGLDLSYGSETVPSPIRPSTVFVVPTPGRDWITFEGQGFCRPIVQVSAVLVGPTSNRQVSRQWLEEKVVATWDVLAGDPTLGGRVSGVMLDAVTEPGLLQTEGGGPVLSTVLRLRPFYLTTNP